MINRVIDVVRHQRVRFLPRVGVVAGLLIAETLARSYLIQGNTPLELMTGSAKAVYLAQSWLLRFVIAYMAAWMILAYARDSRIIDRVASLPVPPVRFAWLVVHSLLVMVFGFLSAAFYDAASPLPFTVAAVAWYACGVGMVLSLLAAIAPVSTWRRVLDQSASLYLYALMAAGVAVVVARPLQLSWVPVARITYWAVDRLLLPFIHDLRSDSSTMSIGTRNFSIVIADKCSGLEGLGLMAAFCMSWFWYGRRQFIFSRSLIALPFAALLIFILNILRIATLLLIGNAGYPQVAMVGFHSQAGWIAFNCAAFGVAAVSYRIPWLRRGAVPGAAAVRDATAAYLVPFLSILAAGMLAYALSSGFDLFYPLRLVSGGVALLIFREIYGLRAWSFSWRPCFVGAMVFGLWVAIGQLVLPASGAPQALGDLSPVGRTAWIACRVIAAVVTVPIAEELAYRGYLMRRLVGAKFESISYRHVSWPAILLSAIVFGIMHGALWPVATLTGVAYAVLVVKSGSLADGVIAHATTNGLLALYVLTFDQWQLW